MELTDNETALIRELLETLLADDQNTMGFFDTTSSGAMTPEEVKDSRAQMWALADRIDRESPCGSWKYSWEME